MSKNQFVFSTFRSRILCHQEGFSLLELAIILIVIGILTSLSLPLVTQYKKSKAINKTREHQQYAIQAIAAYVARHKCFPCPALPSALGAEMGIAQKICRGNRAEGIIPFRTLGISETYAKDGFQRFFTYVVDEDFTYGLVNLQQVKGGHIQVKDKRGNSVVAPTSSHNCVAFLVMSHGESGVGAFQEGSLCRIGTNKKISSDKKENLDGNFIFVIDGQSDDIMKWESRDPFLQNFVRP